APCIAKSEGADKPLRRLLRRLPAAAHGKDEVCGGGEIFQLGLGEVVGRGEVRLLGREEGGHVDQPVLQACAGEGEGGGGLLPCGLGMGEALGAGGGGGEGVLCFL